MRKGESWKRATPQGISCIGVHGTSFNRPEHLQVRAPSLIPRPVWPLGAPRGGCRKPRGHGVLGGGAGVSGAFPAAPGRSAAPAGACACAGPDWCAPPPGLLGAVVGRFKSVLLLPTNPVFARPIPLAPGQWRGSPAPLPAGAGLKLRREAQGLRRRWAAASSHLAPAPAATGHLAPATCPARAAVGIRLAPRSLAGLCWGSPLSACQNGYQSVRCHIFWVHSGRCLLEWVGALLPVGFSEELRPGRGRSGSGPALA